MGTVKLNTEKPENPYGKIKLDCDGGGSVDHRHEHPGSLYAVSATRWGASFVCTYDEVAAGATVRALTVDLTLTGGYNSGLCAYLVAPNGATVMLMNQPGVSSGNPFGATGAGMNITLQDATAANGNI